MDMDKIGARIGNINNEMLKLVMERDGGEEISLVPPPDQLVRVSLQIYTQSQGKDPDSLATFWLEKAGSVSVADLLIANTYLPNNSLNTYKMNIFGTMSRRDYIGSRLWLRLDRNAGKDLWYFDLEVKMQFDDGTQFWMDCGFKSIEQNQTIVHVF